MTAQKCMDIAVAGVKQYIKIYNDAGPLHIVIGDGNNETEYIIWCMRNSIPEIKDDEEYIFNMDVAMALLNVKENKRLSVLRKAWSEDQMKISEEDYKTIYDIVMKTYDLNPSTCEAATNAMLVGVEMALEKVGIIEKED